MPGQFAWEYSIHKHRQNELRITSQLVAVWLKNNEEPSTEKKLGSINFERFKYQLTLGLATLFSILNQSLLAMFDNHQIRRETSEPSLSDKI